MQIFNAILYKIASIYKFKDLVHLKKVKIAILWRVFLNSFALLSPSDSAADISAWFRDLWYKSSFE